MIKKVEISDKKAFNKLAIHPMQSWEWGDFRLGSGIGVIRLGRYEQNKLKETAQITFHAIPFTSYNIGYFPKGGITSDEMLEHLYKTGVEKNCIFIKLEPNISQNSEFRIQNSELNVCLSPHPLFTKYTFLLDLTQSEEELLANMHHKSRYNIRLAEKKGVKIIEDNSNQAFGEYLKLMEETSKRQKFYAHTPSYHKLMWETLGRAKIARLFLAKYKNDSNDEILVAWILFLFNNTLYYPYGASSTKFRNFMPSNLMMWEAIKFGKRAGATKFDMWGALGPDPKSNDPWYGFHKFKEGYGATLTELAGSFDLVVKPFAYSIYNFIHILREIYLKIKR